MGQLKSMPAIQIQALDLAPFGRQWTANGGKLSRTPPHSSSQLGQVFNLKVGSALSTMLGNIPILTPISTALRLGADDGVEVGECRVVGGVRPQNFDVVYRPDGCRFAFDSKTLNDADSVKKNYQNMINDLGTEATTVHIVFPYSVVAFLIAVPGPALLPTQQVGLIGSLERLTQRDSPLDSSHKAEAISLVVWDPATGNVDSGIPVPTSTLRIEKFSSQIENAYSKRYKGLPPHD